MHLLKLIKYMVLCTKNKCLSQLEDNKLAKLWYWFMETYDLYTRTGFILHFLLLLFNASLWCSHDTLIPSFCNIIFIQYQRYQSTL